MYVSIYLSIFVYKITNCWWTEFIAHLINILAEFVGDAKPLQKIILNTNIRTWMHGRKIMYINYVNASIKKQSIIHHFMKNKWTG